MKVVTGVKGYPDEGSYGTRWLTGFWSTQAKVDGIVLKAAWHWGSDCSVVKNNPLGEPGSTPLYSLPSTWGSVDGVTVCFSRFSWEGSLIGDCDI